LAHLEASLKPVTSVETVPLDQALGRVLAGDATALRSHPPHANAAVDGYGFAHGPQGSFELLEGRAAAGAPYEGDVPKGAAIRILTGAKPPNGVDTVVLEEDVLHMRLKVAVLSTGSEVVEVGSPAKDTQIFDANRPMLKALLRQWQVDVIDLGTVPDDILWPRSCARLCSPSPLWGFCPGRLGMCPWDLLWRRSFPRQKSQAGRSIFGPDVTAMALRSLPQKGPGVCPG